MSERSVDHAVLRRQLKTLWQGLPINYKTALKILKRDPVFCDYFNAFLSLPAFSRPLFYDRKAARLLEVYRDCRVPVVGLTIQAPIPGDDVQELLQTWLLKTRLPLFLRTSLYVEYRLCRQLLRVSGALPDREDSEEELTESEAEESSEEGERAIKERNVMDLAGFERSSKMSVVEGLAEPLIDPPTPSLPPESAPPSTVPETTGTQSSLNIDRDLIVMSSNTIYEGSRSTYDSSQTPNTESGTAMEGEEEGGGSTVGSLPDISTAPITTQTQGGSEDRRRQSGAPSIEFVEPTKVYSRAGGAEEGGLPNPPPPPPPDTTVYTATPEDTEPPQPLLPASSELFSRSVAEMLPDSQSDISSPHLWQRIYKNKNPSDAEDGRSPSPSLLEGSYNAEFPELALSKQDRRYLIGSVAAMDAFREFLARTAGEHLLNLWLDITQIEAQLEEESTTAERCADLLRDLQDKYKTRLSSSAKERLLKREYPALRRLRNQVLRKLQSYWLPRYFQVQSTDGRVDPALKLELDEEQLKLPFLPSVAVSRSYPSQLRNLSTVINDTADWMELFKEHDQRIISGKLRNVSASIVNSRKDHFSYGIRSDRNAGGPFRRWLDDHGNTALLHVLSFLEEVLQYRAYEARKADRGILKRAGWRIWHTFMAPGAPQSLQLGPAVTSDIRISLLSTKDYVPSTVFDVAKGNLMLFLRRAWKEYVQEDYEAYLEARPDIMREIKAITEKRIKQMQGQRNNQSRRRYRAYRHKRGKKKKLHTIFDSDHESELEDEDLANLHIPTFAESLTNRTAMDKFSAWASHSLTGERMCQYLLWRDLTAFFELNKQTSKQLRSLQAEHIHRTHFLFRDKKPYNFPNELSSKMSRDQTVRPPSPLLTKTLTFCEPAIEKTFTEFIHSLPLTQAALRKRNASDDNSTLSQQSFVIGGRKRGRGKNKKVPGRATPTKELYHKLLNLLMSVAGTWPEELLLFERYLAEHGAEDGYPLIVNDLHFWVEVQRFKEMHHTDTDPDFILRKLEAIVDCYLDPQIPTDPPPEKPVNLSPTGSPTPSVVSKGQSSNPESPVQSKIDITSTEKTKKLPWAQRKQVDLTVDIGQKICGRLSTPGGHLDKDLSHYDEAQKMVLKELVPFYAGFANQQAVAAAAGSSTRLSECRACPPEIVQVDKCHRVNQKWVGSPVSEAVLVYPLPSGTAAKPKHIHSTKDHFTFTLEHGVTWSKHIDDDMISANSEDGLLKPDPALKLPELPGSNQSNKRRMRKANTVSWFLTPKSQTTGGANSNQSTSPATLLSCGGSNSRRVSEYGGGGRATGPGPVIDLSVWTELQ